MSSQQPRNFYCGSRVAVPTPNPVPSPGPTSVSVIQSCFAPAPMYMLKVGAPVIDSVAVQENVDIIRQSIRRNMLQTEF
jgi:hypothetical protein